MNREEVYVKEEIDGPVDTVWPLIRDFGDISAWARGKVIRTEGTGIGMIRHVDSADGRVIERCEAHDEAVMTFTYRLLESPWPMTDYVATVKLTDSEPGKTEIEWSSAFETDRDEGERIRSGVERLYRDAFIAQLRESVERKIRENN